VTVYLPAFLFAVGQGAVIPIVALVARDVGASIPVAGVIVALRGIGTMAFDVPAGALVERLGERRAMTVGTGALLLSLVGSVASTSPLALGACMFAMGCAWSVWLLARLSYVTDVMPFALRGRALSTLGGVNRVGNFAGPFLGAAAIAAVGLDGAFAVHIVLGLAAWVVLLVVPDPLVTTPPAGHVVLHPGAIARAHAPVFLTAGLGAMSLGALRASRAAVLPLWADQIGLDAAAVGVIFGIASGMDMLLFYPAGSVSDRLGRKHVAVPCLLTLAAGYALLPLTGSLLALAAVAALMGVGNGMGSGIVMTLGADFAPSTGRAAFLGVWRMVSDVGTAGGPLVVAAVAGAATLGTASIVVGGLGVAGAALVALRMPPPPDQVPPGAGPGSGSGMAEENQPAPDEKAQAEGDREVVEEELEQQEQDGGAGSG
jgi:MFS family permease